MMLVNDVTDLLIDGYDELDPHSTAHIKVVELPIAYHERVGRSKLSIVRDGTRFLTTIIWTSLEYNPARVLGIVSMAALIAACSIGLTVATVFVVLHIVAACSRGGHGPSHDDTPSCLAAGMGRGYHLVEDPTE